MLTWILNKIFYNTNSTVIYLWVESESRTCLTLRLHGPSRPRNSPGQNTGVCSLSLLQGIFPTPESNPALLHYQQILCQLSHKGSPTILEWVAYPFSSRSSRLRNQPGVLLYCQANSLPTGSTFMTYWGGNNHHRPLLFFDTNNGKRYEFKKEILDFFYSQ